MKELRTWGSWCHAEHVQSFLKDLQSLLIPDE